MSAGPGSKGWVAAVSTHVLNAVQSGITRLRTKGGASPESLYDAVNCYVTAARTIKPRPGTELFASLSGGEGGGETVGLSMFNGVFQVFTSGSGVSAPAGFKVNVLSHPGGDASLKRIWKAEPFMGGIYVVAEWSNGDVFHYYLVTGKSWSADTVVKPGDIITPDEANGMMYVARPSGEPGTLWEAGAEREVGDVVEPTVANGFKYEVIEAHGNPPRSGSVEPEWPAETDAIVVEEADSQTPPPPTQQQPPPSTPPGYENPGGNYGSAWNNRDRGGLGSAWEVR